MTSYPIYHGLIKYVVINNRAGSAAKLKSARPPFEVVCPICGTLQKSNRSVCYVCACKFVFDDDELA